MALSSHAQFTEGTFLLSGKTGLGFSASGSKIKSDGDAQKIGNTMAITFTPAMGYFFSDNFAAGLSLNLDYSSGEELFFGEEATINSVSFTGGPFIRQYFAKGFFLEGALAAGVQYEKYDFGGGDTDFRNLVYGWSLSAGYAAMVNKMFAIESGIGYGVYTYKGDLEDEVKLVNYGLAITIGVALYLNRE